MMEDKNKAVDIVARVYDKPRYMVAMYTDWVMDYAQGNTDRVPSEYARYIAQLVDDVPDGYTLPF